MKKFKQFLDKERTKEEETKRKLEVIWKKISQKGYYVASTKYKSFNRCESNMLLFENKEARDILNKTLIENANDAFGEPLMTLTTSEEHKEGAIRLLSYHPNNVTEYERIVDKVIKLVFTKAYVEQLRKEYLHINYNKLEKAITFRCRYYV